MKQEWNRKDLLGLEELTPGEINLILDTAESFLEISQRPIKKVPALRGKTVATLFFEPSTRTRVSFELAAKRLSADTISISSATSSAVKGETLKDTAKNIEAMKVDLIILRHSCPGASLLLSKAVTAGVVNAGDGAHEHPTQGLLDIFTIRQKKGKIKGLEVAIIGDISHSRVARSNIWGLVKLGAKVTVCGPATLIPPGIEKLGVHPAPSAAERDSGVRRGGVKVTHNLDEALSGADVVNVLRIQLERQERSLFPSIREYIRLFGVNLQRLEKAKKDLLIMHPGPINRGVEITPEVADGPYSVILEQVTNGLAVRMAVLYLLMGK